MATASLLSKAAPMRAAAASSKASSASACRALPSCRPAPMGSSASWASLCRIPAVSSKRASGLILSSSARRSSAVVEASSSSPEFTAALIFDCDGVIVETEELHRLAYNASFKHFGLTTNGEAVDWTVEYYDILQNTVGGGKPKMRYHFNETAQCWPTTSAGFTPSTEDEKTKLIDDLQDMKTEFYKKIVEEVAEARPGVLDLMDEALSTPGLAVAICSAATKAGFEKVVNSIVGPERLARFDLVLAGDDVTRKKPDPLIYNMASERLGVAPQDCVVIEDSIVGLRAAVGAGMNCIITCTPSTADQDFLGGGAAAVVPVLQKPGLYGVTLDFIFKGIESSEKGEVIKPKITLPRKGLMYV